MGLWSHLKTQLGKDPLSTFSPMVVSRTQFLAGCHYQRSFNFLPHGSLHEGAHNIAAKFFTVSKRESERGEQEGSQRLCNLLWEVESSKEESTGILTRSKSVGPVHTQWEGSTDEYQEVRITRSLFESCQSQTYCHHLSPFPPPLLWLTATSYLSLHHHHHSDSGYLLNASCAPRHFPSIVHLSLQQPHKRNNIPILHMKKLRLERDCDLH